MKFNKVNWAVMAVYPVAGLVLSGLAAFLGGKDLPYTDQDKMMFTVVGGVVLAFLGFFALGAIFYAIGKKRMEAQMKADGFRYTSCFTSYNAVVAIDSEEGRLAIVGRYNPFKVQYLNASRITSAEVKDGKGITGGTSLVSFVFYVDGMKFRIPTFSSNRCYNMKSNEVIRGIEKAEKQVELLLAAKANARG